MDIRGNLGGAIWWGSISSTVIYTTSFASLTWGPELPAALASLLIIGFWIFLVSLVFVTAATLLIGLPFAALLQAIRCEGCDIYAMCGAIAGLLLPPAVELLTAGALSRDIWTVAVPGLIVGAVSGVVWGLSRDRVIEADRTPPTHPNRYHDERILR
jgi:hypothetical protein